jgi:hypothetical protein
MDFISRPSLLSIWAIYWIQAFAGDPGKPTMAPRRRVFGCRPKERTMIRRFENVAIAVLWLGVYGNPAGAQAPPPSILTIDVQNVVEYQGDVSDPAKFSTNPNVTPSAGARPFSVNVALGDIVAVNGQPAKGPYVGRPVGISLNPNATPGRGQAIADTAHASLRSHTFEILKGDGTPVGTIMSFGLDGGLPSPGGAFLSGRHQRGLHDFWRHWSIPRRAGGTGAAGSGFGDRSSSCGLNG